MISFVYTATVVGELAPDGGLRDAELLGNRLLRLSATGCGEDELHVGSLELAASVVVEEQPDRSALLRLVLRVVGLSANEQMARVYAPRVVALVADAEPTLERSFPESPRNTMSPDGCCPTAGYVSSRNAAISMLVSVSGLRPALVLAENANVAKKQALEVRLANRGCDKLVAHDATPISGVVKRLVGHHTRRAATIVHRRIRK